MHEPAVVRLLKPIRIPTCHSKLIHIRADDFTGDRGITLFESKDALKETGLVTEDAVTVPDSDHCFTLVVQNSRLEPVQLDR